MKKKLFLLALLGGLASGCVTAYTTVKDEPRQTVQFASGLAAQTFYDAYIRDNYVCPDEDHANSWVGLDTVPPYQRRKIETDNVLFNRAIEKADTNHDGIISEAEAQGYAAQAAPAKKN
jgi:small ligand-binding sensory domain FIST